MASVISKSSLLKHVSLVKCIKGANSSVELHRKQSWNTIPHANYTNALQKTPNDILIRSHLDAPHAFCSSQRGLGMDKTDPAPSNICAIGPCNCPWPGGCAPPGFSGGNCPQGCGAACGQCPQCPCGPPFPCPMCGQLPSGGPMTPCGACGACAPMMPPMGPPSCGACGPWSTFPGACGVPCPNPCQGPCAPCAQPCQPGCGGACYGYPCPCSNPCPSCSQVAPEKKKK